MEFTNIMGWESLDMLGIFGYMLLDDFSYYWFHRQNHMIRFYGQLYIVHHSSDNFNLGTAVRNGWFTIFYKPFFYVWIVIIGFHQMLVVCMGIEALWQFQLHTM
jgi:sterol desaturase/sphingolipid hydroxylase (fatty acid hydroxylase superfamily)